MKKQSSIPRIKQRQKKRPEIGHGRGLDVGLLPPGGGATPTSTDSEHLPEPAWAKVFLETFLRRFLASSLTRTDMRVMVFLLGNMRYRNVVQTEHWVVADGVGVDRADVTRSIGRLIAADILQRVATADAPSKPYMRFNPLVFYRGNVKEWHADRHANVIRGNFRRNVDGDGD